MPCLQGGAPSERPLGCLRVPNVLRALGCKLTTSGAPVTILAGSVVSRARCEMRGAAVWVVASGGAQYDAIGSHVDRSDDARFTTWQHSFPSPSSAATRSLASGTSPGRPTARRSHPAARTAPFDCGLRSPDNETRWRVCRILEEGHQRTIRWCVWSPDAKFLASCSFDGTASIWEALDGEFDCVAQLEGHENEVKAVAWSASGNLLATCGRDKSVFIWETEDENYEVLSVLHSHAADVKCVQWHPTQEVLASCSYDTVKLYIMSDDDDFRCCSTLTGHTSTVWALCFSPDGTSLASCSDDRTVVLWRDTTGDGVGFVPAYTLRRSMRGLSIRLIGWRSRAIQLQAARQLVVLLTR